MRQEGRPGGQLLLALTPGPQTSAAFAGTIFFLYQIGLRSHLRGNTSLSRWWQWVAMLFPAPGEDALLVGRDGEWGLVLSADPHVLRHFSL